VTIRVEDDYRDNAFRRCAETREALVARLEAIESGSVTAGRIAVGEEIEHYYVLSHELRKAMLDELRRTALPEGVVAQIGETIGEPRRRRRCFSAAASLHIDVSVGASGAVPHLLVADDVARSDGPFFAISESEKLADELRAKAVENARERASLLADAAGRRLGRALVVSDLNESLADLSGAARYDAVPAFATSTMAPYMRGVSTVTDGEPPIVMEISPEPVALGETMTVVFELIDRN
jgi:hypothetical protein